MDIKMRYMSEVGWFQLECGPLQRTMNDIQFDKWVVEHHQKSSQWWMTFRMDCKVVPNTWLSRKIG